MLHAKVVVICIFVFIVSSACLTSWPTRYSVTDSKDYEASLFRQHCAICHGAEGEGKTTAEGLKVPSLREGEFKFHTEDEIYNQLANGGNGMTPFRGQLTDRELHMMAAFVHDKLRKQ